MKDDKTEKNNERSPTVDKKKISGRTKRMRWCDRKDTKTTDIMTYGLSSVVFSTRIHM